MSARAKSDRNKTNQTGPGSDQNTVDSVVDLFLAPDGPLSG